MFPLPLRATPSTRISKAVLSVRTPEPVYLRGGRAVLVGLVAAGHDVLLLESTKEGARATLDKGGSPIIHARFENALSSQA